MKEWLGAIGMVLFVTVVTFWILRLIIPSPWSDIIALVAGGILAVQVFASLKK